MDYARKLLWTRLEKIANLLAVNNCSLGYVKAIVKTTHNQVNFVSILMGFFYMVLFSKLP